MADESALDIYRRTVHQQPVCEDPWFSEALARHRAGDVAAGREISGRCLRLGLSIAESRAGEFAELSVLDLAQEANRALWKSLATFRGATAAEFIPHAEVAIHQEFERLTSDVR